MQISSAFSPREFAMACIRGQTDLVVLLLLRLLVLLVLLRFLGIGSYPFNNLFPLKSRQKGLLEQN